MSTAQVGVIRSCDEASLPSDQETDSSTHFQSWQAIWEESIKNSSDNRRIRGISEMDRINLSAELWHKNKGHKFSLDDLQKGPEFEAELNRLRRFITRDSSVLDIGAGMGRLAVPLAKEVKRMTAIEPARIDMNIMKDQAAREQVGNIEFFDQLWADFQLQEKYDLVYSTWSSAIGDPAALLKMHEASRGYCVLEQVASPDSLWDIFGHIYPLIMGEEFRSPGNYLNIVTTLYDYGIYANIETWRFDKEIKHQNMQEALNIWKMSLGNYTEVNEEIEEKLKWYYRSKMNQDGSYTFSLKGGASCLVWWKV